MRTIFHSISVRHASGIKHRLVEVSKLLTAVQQRQDYLGPGKVMAFRNSGGISVKFPFAIWGKDVIWQVRKVKEAGLLGLSLLLWI